MWYKIFPLSLYQVVMFLYAIYSTVTTYDQTEHLLVLRSSEMLRSVGWRLATDVSVHPMVPIFRGQAVK